MRHSRTLLLKHTTTARPDRVSTDPAGRDGSAVSTDDSAALHGAGPFGPPVPGRAPAGGSTTPRNPARRLWRHPAVRHHGYRAGGAGKLGSPARRDLATRTCIRKPGAVRYWPNG
ncbi:hypothetical protein GCM10007977_105620 [Dactylosporangium sucinum]|uniref:Uncharacterized protein n=1 Tax=Dactylosporangium sucinum TaxID=1424081 RepID=A0A917UE30_9ACTN|nr:hypothetical protein GCM10007977_105620 [Dactylosporangium sucinum]